MINLTTDQAAALRALTRFEFPTLREIGKAGGLERVPARDAVMALIRQGLALRAGSAASGGATFTVTAIWSLALDEHLGDIR